MSPAKSTGRSIARSPRPPQTGFYLLLLVTLVPVAFFGGWMARGLSEGGLTGLPGATDAVATTELQSPASQTSEAEASVELMVELQMLEAQKEVMEGEIAEARASGSGLDAIVEGELRRINEEIAKLKQQQKDSAPTAKGIP